MEKTSTCPAYADLYSEYEISAGEKNEACSKESMWINRLLCSDIFSSHALTCHVYSGSSDIRSNNEGELLMSVAKRGRVFNCLKEFFKRKLFQQQNGTEEIKKINTKTWETLDDINSDYDDVDNLDSSYNADEEDEYEEASDDYVCTAPMKPQYRSISTYKKLKKFHSRKENPLRSVLSFSCWHHAQDGDITTTTTTPTTTTEATTKAKSYSAASTDTEERRISNVNCNLSYDDCCQLIVETPTKNNKINKAYACHKAKKKRHFRVMKRHINTRNEDENGNVNGCEDNDDNNDDDDDDDDIEDERDERSDSWYQPRITTKAVYEHLWKSSPGSFLIRRKARTFELCLRSETKVKHFTVIGANETYKLKGAQKQFSSLKALVTHHSVMAEQLPLTLLLPRDRRSQCRRTTQRYDDDFDTFESLQILGLLQTLQAKNFDDR